MPAEPWAAFVEMRRAIPKVPFTPRAMNGIIARLGEFHAEAKDIAWILMESVTKGYRGVFGDRAPLDKTVSTATGTARTVPALDSSGEGEEARQIRDLFIRRAGQAIYDSWVRPSRLDLDEANLTIVAPTEFMSQWQKGNFSSDFQRIAVAVLGRRAEVYYRAERPPPVADQGSGANVHG